MAAVPYALVLEHHGAMGAGRIAAAAEDAGLTLRTVRGADGELPPRDLTGVTALVVLDGALSVADRDEFPWLRREVKLCAEALHGGIPVLGVGLGARVLALAAGGEAGPLTHQGQPWFELGWAAVTFTDDATAAGPFRAFPKHMEVLHWHREAVTTPPPDATVCASSPVCPVQAFTLPGGHVGCEFHPGLTAEMVTALCDARAADLELLGLPPVRVTMDVLRRVNGIELYGDMLLGRFFDGAAEAAS